MWAKIDETYLNTEMLYLGLVRCVGNESQLNYAQSLKFVGQYHIEVKSYIMSNKSLKSSQILRAHMTYFRRPSHIW